MKKLLAGMVVAVALVGCGGPAQTDACKKYITCQTAVSSAAGTALDAAYGPNGTCWKSTSEAAAACDTACKTNTTTLATANPDKTECK